MIREIPRRHSDRLIEARRDNPGTRYFVTFCTDERRKILTRAGVAERIFEEAMRMRDEDAVVESSVIIMPDHVHWLFRRGAKLTLGQLMGRLKSKTGPALKTQGGAWQRNYFEHRLRPEDLMEEFALYMFLNPYRARLISHEEAWPHWHRSGDLCFEFEAALSPQGTPPASWSASTPRPFGSPPQGAASPP